jgi:exodeoxyribonuclease VII small subunit
MKPKKKAVPPKPDQGGPSFEEAIRRLEKIVAEMEEAELPLEELLKRYEEGTRLVRFCSHKLEEAEKKIEMLTKTADGSVELEPFEAEAEAESTESAAAESAEPPSREGNLL